MIEAVKADVAISAEDRERALVVIADYKARLEARKMDLEASQQRLNIWLGQWEGYRISAQTAVAAFDGQIKGYEAEVEKYRTLLSLVETRIKLSEEERQRATLAITEYRARLEGQALILQAADSRIKAWATQWEGYKAAADAKAKVFTAQVGAFTANVEAEKAVLEGEVAYNTGIVQNNKNLTDQYIAIWEGIKAHADAAAKVLDASTKPLDAAARIAGVQVQEKQSQLQLAADTANLQLQSAAKQAELYMAMIQSNSETARRSLDVLGSAGANIMSAFLAAGQINLSGRADASMGMMTSVDTNYNYSGEI